jgi:hypothetical protein
LVHRLGLAWSLRMYTLRATDDLLAKERYLVLKDPFASAALLASGRSLERSEHIPKVSRQPHICAGGSHSAITCACARSRGRASQPEHRSQVYLPWRLWCLWCLWCAQPCTPRQGSRGAASASCQSRPTIRLVPVSTLWWNLLCAAIVALLAFVLFALALLWDQ